MRLSSGLLRSRSIGSALLLLCLAGCEAKGPALYPISGVVTFDGKPLLTGSISFDPADGKGSAYSGDIVEGKYSLACEPGEKRVSIRASRPSSKPGPDGGPDFEQYLPGRYNMATKLTTKVEAIETNVRDFALTSR